MPAKCMRPPALLARSHALTNSRFLSIQLFSTSRLMRTMSWDAQDNKMLNTKEILRSQKWRAYLIDHSARSYIEMAHFAVTYNLMKKQKF